MKNRFVDYKLLILIISNIILLFFNIIFLLDGKYKFRPPDANWYAGMAILATFMVGIFIKEWIKAEEIRREISRVIVEFDKLKGEINKTIDDRFEGYLKITTFLLDTVPTVKTTGVFEKKWEELVSIISDPNLKKNFSLDVYRSWSYLAWDDGNFDAAIKIRRMGFELLNNQPLPDIVYYRTIYLNLLIETFWNKIKEVRDETYLSSVKYIDNILLETSQLIHSEIFKSDKDYYYYASWIHELRSIHLLNMDNRTEALSEIKRGMKYYKDASILIRFNLISLSCSKSMSDFFNEPNNSIRKSYEDSLEEGDQSNSYKIYLLFRDFLDLLESLSKVEKVRYTIANSLSEFIVGESRYKRIEKIYMPNIFCALPDKFNESKDFTDDDRANLKMMYATYYYFLCSGDKVAENFIQNNKPAIFSNLLNEFKSMGDRISSQIIA